jgi:microfibrillar-associated protein 1
VQAKPSAASHTVTPGLEIPEGFETASEDESGSGGADKSGSGSGSEESSSEEEVSSSEEEVAPRKLVRPVFIKKTQRAAPKTIPSQTPEELEAHRKAQADAFLQETLERAAADKAAGKKHWDDEDNLDEAEFVDDTDPADPEAAATERAKWKLRELHRVKRERAMIEEAEAERAEVERRRNLSAAERDAEDREFLEKQKEEKGERGSMSFMQKYFHKGAFFQDDLKASGVDRRDLMGAKFEDATNREILPEYMQIRDMTKLGKKSRTKYRDMKSEDTGRWGDFERRGPRQDGRLDERFRPDGPEGRGPNVTGANSGPLGERKRGGELEDRGGKRPRVDDR